MPRNEHEKKMQPKPRYAIYYAPPAEAAFARFGASILGYDAHSGKAVPIAAVLAQSFPNWRDLAAEPARYGFHATLKAPFELAPATTEDDLLLAARAVARRLQPLDIGILEIAEMGRFLALVPLDQTTIREIAADIVRSLDQARAPLSDADRARRFKSPLSERQIAYLDLWGYPNVMDEFRFHMTLTGPVDDAAFHAAARETLTQLHATVSEPVVLDALTVFRQLDRTAAFTTIARYALEGRAA